MKLIFLSYLATSTITTTIGTAGASSPSTPPSSSATTSRDALEAARYGPLPPTVFAPGGRLHGVERVAREAYPPGEDELSCAVFALRCGGRNNIKYGGGGGARRRQQNLEQHEVPQERQLSHRTSEENGERDNKDESDTNEEFAVMVGIGAISPYLHRDEMYSSMPTSQESTGVNEANDDYIPLALDEADPEINNANLPSSPMAILSPTLLTGAGGKGIDSAILLRRSIEVALSMYRSDNGGVEWFVSHSLEGTAASSLLARHSEQYELLRSMEGARPVGGASGVEVAELVRRLADIAQGCTQSLGGKYGRMLSSSLLAIGLCESQNRNDKIALWRVDPTGQFWQLDASAVGRGAINVEAELLQLVKNWLLKQTQNSDVAIATNEESTSQRDQDLSLDVTNHDVKAYLCSLSVEEAVDVAIDCLVKGIMGSMKREVGSPSIEKEKMQLQQELRKRVHAVVMRSNVSSSRRSVSPPSFVQLVSVR